ncbi:hypothetical protein N0V90_010399 [Kalmusia sp. IMI 367209]|nr:hypothetical protein N0V90_010399 [Kalmusia sp. IMI 367209]
MRATSTQKAYDEAFLACSTAVYFESQVRCPRVNRQPLLSHFAELMIAQNNEAEALRSWKTALDHIYYHNAHRAPSLARPTSETERALVESLRQLELQCKERVDLLEALKRSREESGEKLPSLAVDTQAPTPPPHGTPLVPADSNASSNWLGGGTIPPVDYTDLSRPPLPSRPSLAPRKSSGAESARTLYQDHECLIADACCFRRQGTANTFAGEEGPDAENIEAGERLKVIVETPEFDEAQSPSFSRSTDALGSIAYVAPPTDNGSESEQTAKPQRLPRKCVPASSSPRHSFDASRSKSFQANAPIPVLPSYRNEYPDAPPNARFVAASAAARSWPDSKPIKQATETSHQLVRTVNDNRVLRARKEPPEPIAVETDDHENKTRPPPRRKIKAKEITVRADLPPTPSSEVDDSDESECDSDEWKERVRGILKNLPRGVDEAAAKQILNEIVIQGDEVHWSDVSGLDVAKSALKETVVYPFLRPDLFMGLREPARGMLLFGPPGTGKTMLARAVATESHSTFFAISASSLTSKFLGESEKLVRALFALAKMLAPSIIFIDEIDSLLSTRSSSGEHEATRRIKTEFLIQWSDLAKAAAGKEQTERDKERGDASRVLVLAATNLPWAIDVAARRRFVRRQYIPLPEDHVRKSQVQTLLSHQKHELSEADLDCLVQLTDGFSGSDITALAKDAAMGPLRSLGEKLLHMTMDEIRPIRFEDFRASLQTIRPSVSRQGLKEYEDWAREFGERGR